MVTTNREINSNDKDSSKFLRLKRVFGWCKKTVWKFTNITLELEMRRVFLGCTL